MTFTNNPLGEAILIELRGIRAELAKTATAYTKMVKIVEEGRGAGGRPPSAPPQNADESEPRKRRNDGEPKEILSVTGYVLHFGQAVNAANNDPKLTKSGKPYWILKLTNDFIANVFSTSQAKVCVEAYDEKKPLIVDYVKQGKYSNIESVKLGVPEAPREREPGEDDDSDPF